MKLCFLFSKLVNARGREIPCANPLLKEHIDLAVSPALGFRKAEVRPTEEGAGTSPEEARLGLPIPCLGAKHGRHQDADYDVRLFYVVSTTQ